MIEDRNLYKTSEISYKQTELNLLETFTAIWNIPIPEEICIEWLLSDRKVEKAKSFLQSLKEKGALQFDEKQKEYTIQPAWRRPVCCQEQLRKNYNRLVALSGDSLEKRDILKSDSVKKFVSLEKNTSFLVRISI